MIKEEEDPSDDLLGQPDAAVSNSANGQEKHDDEDDEDDEDEEEDGQEDGAEDGAQYEGDLQVAWEVLDVARIILEKETNLDNSNLHLLSETYTRLGDLMKLNGKLDESISEYKKALELKSKLCSKHDRALSNIHFLIAIAYIYRAAEKSNIDPLQDKREALEHYQLSKEVLCKKLEIDGDSISTTSKEEIKELIDELSENVDALRSEIDETVKPSKSSISSSSAGVTTIGFGGNSSSSSTAVLSSAVAINSTNAKDVEVVTLQAKKKQKTGTTESSVTK